MTVVARENKCDWVLLAICLFFSLALAIWWLLDHTYPQWDAANHTKAAIEYSSLLRHAHVFSGAWYKEFLSVDYQYPLVVNLINGFLKAVFGVSRLSEIVAYVIYQLILLIGIYGLGRTILKDNLAAAIAAVLINYYPLVSSLSHVQLLDYASLCFNSLALLGIARWLERPQRSELVLMTLSVALAANCKQISAFFLIAPCVFLFCHYLARRDYKRVSDLVIAGGTTILSLACWVLPNYQRLRTAQIISTSECLQEGSYWEICYSHAFSYLTGLPLILSPLLFLLVVVSLIWLLLKKFSFRLLWLPFLANFSGVFFMCLVAACRPELRYVAPVTISCALVSSIWLAQLWRRRSFVTRAIACLFGLVATAQFLVFNYSPYPISLPPALSSQLKQLIQGALKEGAVEPPSSPLPPGDLWAQEWLVDTIQSHSLGQAVRLNVLPSIAEISVHTLEVVALYKKAIFDISSFRRFTLGGDVVVYDQQSIDYYNWYAVKNGKQSGFKFANQTSENNYNRIQLYIERSGAFDLIGVRPLPDGSSLSLYRRR